MKKHLTLASFTLLLFIPFSAFANSANCYPSVDCDTGQDAYGTPILCRQEMPLGGTSCNNAGLGNAFSCTKGCYTITSSVPKAPTCPVVTLSGGTIVPALTWVRDGDIGRIVECTTGMMHEAFNGLWVNGVSGSVIAGESNNEVSTDNPSFAMGRSNIALGWFSTAMGISNTVNGDYSSAIGYNNTSNGQGSVALGMSNVSNSQSTVALGDNSQAIGLYAVAIGSRALANELYSVALGRLTTASGQYSASIGSSTTASGNYSTAMGNNTTASGQYSTALGLWSEATGYASTAIGSSARAQAYQSTAIGLVNAGGGNPNSYVVTDPLFEIGNGISWANPNTAFKVNKDGNIDIVAGDPENAITKSNFRIHKPATLWGANVENFRLLALDNTSAGNCTHPITGATNVACPVVIGSNNAFTSMMTGTLFSAGQYIGSPAFRSPGMEIYTEGGGIKILDTAGGGITIDTVSGGLTVYSDSDGGIDLNSATGGISNKRTGNHPVRINDPDGLTVSGPITATGKIRAQNGSNGAELGGGSYGVYGWGTTYGAFVSSSVNSSSNNYAIYAYGSNTGEGKAYGVYVVAGDAAKPGGGSWSSSSDERLKDVEGDYEKGLDEILQLEPVSFHYKKDNHLNLPSDEQYVGFIAQAVQKVFPEAVKSDANGYLDFNMHSVNVAVVNAIQELKSEKDADVAELKAETEALRAEVAELKAEIEEMKSLFAN